MKVCLRIKPYIQPFERKLAFLELRALANAEPAAIDGGIDDATEFFVETRVTPSALAERLAFWETVTGRREYATKQVLLEATTNIVRNGVPLDEISRRLPFDVIPALPNRRCLRYGTHGIHEYRGKFFPQLVRGLLNISEIRRGGIVADPMCGSGTTIVEAVTGGFVGLGADINPLSVLMARTKAALLATSTQRLRKSYERLRRTLLESPSQIDGATRPYFEKLPDADQAYLTSWFSEQVLTDLDRISLAIEKESDDVIRDFFRLSLSNIIRSVSWQKLDDLRVRKEVRLSDDIDPVKEFLEGLGRAVRSVLAVLRERADAPTGRSEIAEQSATSLARAWPDYVAKVDTIVTSPPYATALPYLDTDRLSLSYLGLLPRAMHRLRDGQMIGNREISERERRTHWDHFSSVKSELPSSVAALVERINMLNTRAVVGFRRRNLAALLGRYFLDMQAVLGDMKQLLRKNGRAYVVVGNNSTIAGGEPVSIETAALLADVATRVGFKVEHSIPMEMLVSRDIFRKNAMGSEVILCLRRR
ncbi:MAG TPA: hypothetical protein VFC39_00775 [Acidobacteriaceae bacterium]|nr:hypothetical protein [Acidobacteriaceae bacterium]